MRARIEGYACRVKGYLSGQHSEVWGGGAVHKKGGEFHVVPMLEMWGFWVSTIIHMK